MNRRVLRVLMLEDSSADAELIAHALTASDLRIVAECVDTRATFEKALGEFHPHVIISDHALARFDADDAMRLAHEICPTAPVIIVTGGLETHRVVDALRAGAEAVVLKSALSPLLPAIRKALAVRGDLETLSPRQLEVLRFIAQGYTTLAIAERLRLSAKTIETHRSELMKRLGIHDLATLVRFAIRVGMVTLEW